MEDRVTVSDAIVSELELARVDTLFGIISIHNIPIYDAVARHGGFRVIKPRGESGAVNMADAYGRIGDRLGVAITSTGTGAGNAAGSMIEAATAGTPLLHLTGQVASEYLESGRGYIHECRDQLAMLKSIGKAAYRVRQPEQAPGVVRRAILEALEPPTGPVSVEIPIDFQAALIARAEIATPVAVPLSVDRDFLEELAERILAADRPVMWAGSGVIRGHASDEFEKLARLVDAAVLTSHGGRGAFPEDDETLHRIFRDRHPSSGVLDRRRSSPERRRPVSWERDRNLECETPQRTHRDRRGPVRRESELPPHGVREWLGEARPR